MRVAYLAPELVDPAAPWTLVDVETWRAEGAYVAAIAQGARPRPGALGLLLAHLTLARGAPRRYLDALGLALALRGPGPGGLAQALARFARAGALAAALLRESVELLHEEVGAPLDPTALVAAHLAGLRFGCGLRGEPAALAPGAARALGRRLERSAWIAVPTAEWRIAARALAPAAAERLHVVRRAGPAPAGESRWLLHVVREAALGRRAPVRPGRGALLARPGARRYALITPCRDEAEFARRTLESVVRQTLPPAVWVIVDDGSRDETPAILAEYAARHPFIRVLRREDRGGRSVGPGVIEAFYHGYQGIDPRTFDYVCKLDLDIELPPRYFETLIERMELDPRLGTCSGKAYFPGPSNHERSFAGELISEGCGDETSLGMVKLYRRQCFAAIGGFVREVMWDGIDCHRCRQLGWKAASWDDPELRFLHLRPMGSSHKGLWTGRARHGFGQYYMGTGPLYMAASALLRSTRRPRGIGGLAMLWGYARAWLSGAPRHADLELRRFVRAYQRSCLLRGKRAATARLDKRQTVAWRRHEGRVTQPLPARQAA